ncbi:unnamed protein product, partial [Linum tenue]
DPNRPPHSLDSSSGLSPSRLSSSLPEKRRPNPSHTKKKNADVTLFFSLSLSFILYAAHPLFLPQKHELAKKKKNKDEQNPSSFNRLQPSPSPSQNRLPISRIQKSNKYLNERCESPSPLSLSFSYILVAARKNKGRFKRRRARRAADG